MKKGEKRSGVSDVTDMKQRKEKKPPKKQEESVPKKQIALITGASSGLGRELAYIAGNSNSFDEIWIAARRRHRLEEVKTKVIAPVKILCCDLTEKKSIREIQKELEENDVSVRLLINCAGMGRIGRFDDIPLDDAEATIDLNCRALVTLTQVCLSHMSREARIMNISSIAAFQPIPYLNIYAASKSFVYRYSRALRYELRRKGISVTVVCPYWIKDTEFIDLARITGNKEYIRSFPFPEQQRYVACTAYRDTTSRKAVSTPGLIAPTQRVLGKVLPDSLIMHCWNIVRKLK